MPSFKGHTDVARGFEALDGEATYLLLASSPLWADGARGVSIDRPPSGRDGNGVGPGFQRLKSLATTVRPLGEFGAGLRMGCM